MALASAARPHGTRDDRHDVRLGRRGLARSHIAVLLTGMGIDGVEGPRRVEALGGRTVAQDEKTSVVWGMPRAAVEAGVGDEVLALVDIPQALLRLVAATAR